MKEYDPTAWQVVSLVREQLGQRQSKQLENWTDASHTLRVYAERVLHLNRQLDLARQRG